MSDGFLEERFRRALDEHGLLRPGQFDPPSPEASFVVFAQRPDARLDLDSLRRNASRFFGARLGLTVEKHYGEVAPETDAARVVLASDDGLTSGTRLCFGRRADLADRARIEAAERAAGTTGMALLAQRCATVWLVEGGHEDRVALLVAAIFASVLLGPIVPPRGDEAFGVRTARLRLEGRAAPYR
jgi:hypothetical protein